jgi:hypothetical protein
VNKLLKPLTSLRLTVVCLSFAILLIFVGTLAQVHEGTYIAQTRYFRSLVVFWSPQGSHTKFPILPGGYLIGGILLINLIASHLARFKFSKNKIGILVTHFGLILLLLGQFATDLLSHESQMRLGVGETKSYSEAFHETELALIDSKSDSQNDHIYAISDSLLAKKKTIESSKLPVTVRVINYWQNAAVFPIPPIATNIPSGTILPKDLGVTVGDTDRCVYPKPRETDPERRDIPAVLVEFLDGSKSLGKYLFWMGDDPQTIEAGGKSYEATFRPERDYYPFTLTLLDATHEKYKGTGIPKNFSSRVRIENPEKHEARETQIYMNNPLRYAGLTFFQYQMSEQEFGNQPDHAPESTFQVVRNPSWVTPYLACILVAAGLIIQFMMHLVNFATKRRNPPSGQNAKTQSRKENSKASREVQIS